MRKIILLLFAVLFFNNCVYSATGYSFQLSNIEKSLFGYEYAADSDANRLSRIEKQLYGNASSGDVNKRISKISGDLGINPNTVNKTDNTVASSSKKNPKTAPPQVNEDPSVEYPIIDKIEQKVLNETHHGENIYARLDRLETKMYSKISDEDLSSRVNKLRLTAFDNSDEIKQKYSYSSDYDKVGSNYSSSNDVEYDSKSYNYSSTYSGSNANNLSYKLTAIEEALFRRSYTSDGTSMRLSRIEAKLFKREFSDDTEFERVERIAAAASAKQSSGLYDNNKLMRNLSTGIQVGGFILMILAMLL